MSDLYTAAFLAHRSLTVVVVVIALLAATAHAQTTPDAGSLLREAERAPRALPTPLQAETQQPPPASEADSIRVLAKAIEFSGNALLTQSQLQDAVAPWVGQELNFSQLQQVVEAVTQAYRQRGWLATAKLPAQDVSEGTIRIHILESHFGQIHIDNGGQALRIHTDLLMRVMTERQQPGAPFNLDALERSGGILNDLPGVSATPVLSAGQQEATSDVILKVQDKPLGVGSLQLDNTGSRFTGESKLSFNGAINNPSGIGDQISLSANTTDGRHSRYVRAGYALPIGHDGWRAGVNASTLDYNLKSVDAVSDPKAKGDAKTQGLQLSYPLLRGSLHNVSFSATYDWKTYANEMNALPSSHKRIHAGALSLSGDHVDGWGNGGMTLWGAGVTAGQIDLSGNANNQNADSSGPRTEGHFEKLSANIARLQRLTPSLSLWASLTAQQAGKNLDSSEKMSLGGPSGVRAYPVMEAVGDNGVLSTLELRYSLNTDWQLTAFYDHGRIHRDHNASYPGAPVLQTVALAGRGIGVNWSHAGQWAVRGALAHRNGDNPLADPQKQTDQDGSLKKYRVWLTGVYSF
mgnify:CR=1 FL=1